MTDDRLVYRQPPKARRAMTRRVYVLPRSLVERIHAYGYERGHESEVAAVRELLTAGLDLFDSRQAALAPPRGQ